MEVVVYLVHFVAMVTGDTSGLREDPSAWVRFRQLPASLRLGASGCVDASRRIEADHDGPDRIVTDRNATQRNATHDKRTRVGRPLALAGI